MREKDRQKKWGEIFQVVAKYGKICSEKCVEMYHVLKSNNVPAIVVVLVNFMQFFPPQRSSFQILFHF